MLEQPPIPVYSAESAKKAKNSFMLYQSVFVLPLLQHPYSVAILSMNTLNREGLPLA